MSQGTIYESHHEMIFNLYSLHEDKLLVISSFWWWCIPHWTTGHTHRSKPTIPDFLHMLLHTWGSLANSSTICMEARDTFSLFAFLTGRVFLLSFLFWFCFCSLSLFVWSVSNCFLSFSVFLPFSLLFPVQRSHVLSFLVPPRFHPQ